MFDQTIQDDFKKIPGSPIAYWVSVRVRSIFEKEKALDEIGKPRVGLQTSDNKRFLRMWCEVDVSKVGFAIQNRIEAKRSLKKWFAYNKGGEFRKWYGNNAFVVNWENDGKEIREYNDFLNSSRDSDIGIANTQFYFQESATWSFVSASYFGARYSPPGFVFDTGGSSIFGKKQNIVYLTAFLCSKLATLFLVTINPTLNFQPGNIAALPVIVSEDYMGLIQDPVIKCISVSRADWDLLENSWDFADLPIMRSENKKNAVSESYQSYRNQCYKMTAEMKSFEEENNRLFIEAYGLQGELTKEVPIEEITLFANPKYRHKGELTNDELETRFKADTMRELISYAVGCMMGRYSLDVPGLIYAHTENKGFDPHKYKIFPADEDGIIPITQREWFNDDAPCRFLRFIETAWDKKGLDENLDFITDAVGRKSGESSRDAIRRYFVNNFYKDHCQTYKKRPIYWLFTSGKEKAFQALVYLHRYNEGTLARMRTEYVLPLQTKIMRHIEHLEKDQDSTSGSAVNRIQKEIVTLQKQQAELSKFDERLRHYADMRIKIDLDDGVKANYGKFGELLSR